MGEYFLPTEIELSDIQRVESMIEAKLEHMERNACRMPFIFAQTRNHEL